MSETPAAGLHIIMRLCTDCVEHARAHIKTTDQDPGIRSDAPHGGFGPKDGQCSKLRSAHLASGQQVGLVQVVLPRPTQRDDART